ncbi:MAG: hypothetical protein PHE54_05240, partial [Bacilli bacterium]|nr:hypothetical protein [Bacilli bacterium]
GEYVYVKNIGNKLTYYYTGRNKDDSSNLLRTLIENESSMIKESITVNGRTVNKVIGSRASKSTMKNYVWYSGYLWQVLETNDDGIKMVMAYSITSIPFGSNSDYSTSYIRQWLNEDGVFYDELNRTDLLTDTNICLDSVGENSTVEVIQFRSSYNRTVLRSITPISVCSNSINDKVGILTVEDYAYSYDGTLNEYPFDNSDIYDDENSKMGGLMAYNYLDDASIFYFSNIGNSSNEIWATLQFTPSLIGVRAVSTDAGGVKPVITLKNEVIVKGGTGLKNDPYVIDEGYSLEKGSSLSSATIGEYIYINEGNNPYETNQNIKENVRYRIIGIDEKGIKVERDTTLTKLPATIAIAKSYDVPYYSNYREETNSSLWCYYDVSTSTTYAQGCNGNNYMQSIGSGSFGINKGYSIGYFLNDADNSFYSWIVTKYKNIIETINWELTAVDSSTNILTNNNIIGNYNAKINLPSFGDILSGNDCGNIDYWYQNSALSSDSRVSFKNSNGGIGTYYTYGTSLYSFAVRPVFYLDLDVTISSGTGTKENPYRLEV